MKLYSEIYFIYFKYYIPKKLFQRYFKLKVIFIKSKIVILKICSIKCFEAAGIKSPQKIR